MNLLGDEMARHQATVARQKSRRTGTEVQKKNSSITGPQLAAKKLVQAPRTGARDLQRAIAGIESSEWTHC
jgi:hypothetical protein